MTRRHRPRRRPCRFEHLETRRLLAVDVIQPLADITVSSGAEATIIDLAAAFDLAEVTGTVVRFTSDLGPDIYAELFDALGEGRVRTTPETVDNFLAYVDAGLYTNTIFHRSVPGFVIQGGGFRATDPAAENIVEGIPQFDPVVNEPGNPNVRGTLAMAKLGGDPNSATNQFFVSLDDNREILDDQNGGFTVFGRVLGDGMDVVDAIATLPRFNFGSPFNELPAVGLDDPDAITRENLVTVTGVSRVGELVFTATSSDPTLAAATIGGDGSLLIDYAADRGGEATITVRAASVFDPADFSEQQFTVRLEAPPEPEPPAPEPEPPAPEPEPPAPEPEPPAPEPEPPAPEPEPPAPEPEPPAPEPEPPAPEPEPPAPEPPAPEPPAPEPNARPSVVVTGSEIGAGSQPWVTVIDPVSGATLNRFLAYEPGFRGGVRVALGDVVGDGTEQIIAAPGPGRVGEIRVFRQDGTELVAYRTLPFGGGYRGGVEVAAGDIDGNGVADIVAAVSRGPGQVNAFFVTPASARPVPASPSRSLVAFPAWYQGGATVTTADVGTFSGGRLVNADLADGRAEVVVGSGPGLAPQVLIYDLSGTPTLVRSIEPLTPDLRGGVSVSAGRYDADAIDDIIVAGGFGSGSEIEVYSGRATPLGGSLLARQVAFASLASAGLPVHAAPLVDTASGRIGSLAVVEGAGRGQGIRRLGVTTPLETTLASLLGPLRVAASR